MDTEKIILLSGLCATVVVITYILFGPPVHPSRKKGNIGGLVNVGETCFLNSLLQALSSMPLFVEWLAEHRHIRGSLIEALHVDLSVVNGLHQSIYEDPYLPTNVIKSLHRGWNIPCGEQDVHELFNVIMTTIEEEIKMSTAESLSLADALDQDENANQPKCNAKTATVWHEQLCDDGVINTHNKHTHLPEDRGEAFGPKVRIRQRTTDDSSSLCQEERVPTVVTYRSTLTKGNLETGNISEVSSEFFNDVPGVNDDRSDSFGDTADGVSNTSESEVSSAPHLHQNLQSKSEYTSVNKPVDANLRLIQSEATELRERQVNGPVTVSGVEAQPIGDWVETRRKQSGGNGLKTRSEMLQRLVRNKFIVPPCEGFITTQTHCVTCHYRSPVKYDTFKYIPLLLPPTDGRLPIVRLTLYNLLDKFISTEVVADVECDGCNRLNRSPKRLVSNALKVSNFGKLPKCLAFHIQRTVWTKDGPYKRFDFVEFPEILSMGSYTYSEIQRRKLVKRCNSQVANQKSIINRSRNIYLLQAVIKHEGTVEKGHFVTFRRSPVRPKRWYYTSDSEVEEINLERVLEVPAYMVFYTRC